MSGYHYGFIARVYDAEYAFQDDVALLRARLAEEHVRGAILELGCGTGRVAIPLAEAGFAVTGVDLSAVMLRRARQRRRDLPPDVASRLRFSLQDMTCFRLPRRFAAAVIAFSTLNLVPEPARRRACLGRVHGHLEPGGLLLLDCPAVHADSQPYRGRVTFPLPGRGLVAEKRISERFDARRRCLRVRYDYQVRRWTDGVTVDRLRVRFALAVLDRLEVEQALEAAGFVVESLVGDYRGRPFGSRSPRMIFTARRE